MSTGLSVRYLEDGLLLTDTDGWGWWRLALVPYEFLDDPGREALATTAAGALAGLGETTGHLLIVRLRHDPNRWARHLAGDPAATGPGWAAYVEATRVHVERRAFFAKEVYLGVRLGDRHHGGIGGWRRRIEHVAGLNDALPAGDELDRWRTQADLTSRILAGGLPARPATASELAWLIRRSFWRGITEPPPLAPTECLAGAAVGLLAEGVVHNARRQVRLEQEEGSAVVAGLAFARFPDTLAFPGGEWLATLDALPFPVEASVRFKIVPPRVAAKDAARKLAEATDQARHIAGTSAAIPLALAEAAERARSLEYALHKERTPLLYAWPRLLVAAPDDDTLTARVLEVTEWYRDAGIDVARPSGDQLGLLLEAVPGQPLRVKAYEQRQAPLTLAGAMATATAELGDGTGPYLGTTGGRTVTPVHFDPLAAARENRPTAIAITGTSGAGKTTLSRLLGYQLALRGTWVTAVDPKGERGGLDSLVPAARTLTLGAEHAGLLNPFALAPTPAEAVPVAVGAAQLILPGRLGYDQHAALLEATAAEADTAGPAASLSGVAERLAGWPTDAGRSLAQTLAVSATLPLARLCFAPPGGAALSPQGINVLRIAGLRAPESGTNAQDWTLDQRLSVAVLYLLAQAVLRLFEQTSPAQPKAVILDEAWMLTATAQGRALIPALSRMGRSKNAAVLLVSQNAGDLLGSETLNNCEQRFCFRATDDTEISDVLRLLGVADTPAHRQTVRSLPTGACVYSDLAGRVGVLHIDLALPELAAAFDTTPGRPHPQVVAA